MVFNSVLFFLTLAAFLPVYALARRASATAGKSWILLYSYFFYGMWNPAFLLLLLGSTLVDYGAARGMRANPARRKLLLLASLTTNLGMLGFFKYFNFFAETFAAGAALLGYHVDPAVLDVLLPVGISFYTFQTLSYTIDVYRGDVEARSSLLDVAVYVAFFPQLVAGPILRASDFLPEVEANPPMTASDFADGLFLVLFGLFLKSVVADNVAPRVDELFDGWSRNGIAGNWAAGMLFGVQIHGDFSGYSMTAIGLARMMGFRIPKNFFAPYGAVGFSDFWKRWHISLSSWLRDYLYIPLGGNRGSTARTYVNLMLTMLLGGLWHGASFMFVLWGALHGIYLCVERALRGAARHGAERMTFAGALLGAVPTYLLVSVTWIPFRAQTGGQCRGMLAGLFTGPLGDLAAHGRDFALAAAVFALHFVWARRDFVAFALGSRPVRFVCLVFFALALYLYSGDRTEFIYFQF